MLKARGKTNRALIYLRHSPKPKEKQTLDSLDSQRDACQRYAAFAGLEIVHTLEQPFVSARKVPFMMRGGAEILELARKAAIRHVIVQRVDRVFRDTADGLTAMKALQSARVSMHFADEGGSGLNCGSATGKFLFTMRLAAASYEPDLTSERTSDAHKRRMYNMVLNTSSPPYGFAIVDAPVNGVRPGKKAWKLDFSETEIRNLQLMHKWHQFDNCGWTEIADCLNALAVSENDKTYLSRSGEKWNRKKTYAMYTRALARRGFDELMTMIVDSPEPLEPHMKGGVTEGKVLRSPVDDEQGDSQEGGGSFFPFG